MTDNGTAKGPDFSNCGNPVDWFDQQAIDDRFPQAIANALATPAIDIELARWTKEDALVDEYTKWWNTQLAAIRRHLTTVNTGGLKPVISRRTDKGDGFTKCYVRFDRRRPKVVAA